MKLTLIATLAILTATSPSFAQEAAAPAAQGAPAATSNFSDEDIQKFALAISDAKKIFADPATPDPEKEGRLVLALKQRGLEMEKFNAIGEAAEKDPALRQKIQAAISAQP